MAKNNKYAVPFRRKREGKTDYRIRLKLLIGEKPRLVIRKSQKHVSLQLVQFEPAGDKVLASAHTKELAKLGWKAATNNTSAAYLAGLLLASKVKKSLDCILDLGQQVSVKGSLLYAAVKGCIDGGLKVPCSNKVFPSDARINGEHVAAYAKSLLTQKALYDKQFSGYIKAGIDPQKLPALVKEVKTKLGAK